MAALNNEGRWIELENLGKAIKSNARKIKRQLHKSKSVSKRLKHKKKSVKSIKKRIVKKVKRKLIQKKVVKKSSKKKSVHRKSLIRTEVKPAKKKMVVKESVKRHHNHGLLWLAKNKKKAPAAKKPLNEALRDLNAELKILLKDKNSLEHNDEKVSSQMAKKQAKELQLRAEISKLMRNLSVLDNKKGSLKDKLSSVDKQIDKVKAIRREMEDV